MFVVSVLVGFLCILIPISLLLWIANIFTFVFTQHEDPWLPVSPVRWVLSFLIPLLMVKWSLRKRSLDSSGATAAFVVGFVTTMSNYCFIAAILSFFLTGSKATKFRGKQKKKLETEFKEGGQRNWVQVVCNGGVATEIAVLSMIESGCGEGTIDFSQYYLRSWLSMAVLGAISASSGDTLASELGSVLGTAEPRLITSFRKVPRGTNGAISLMGSLASLLGGLIVGLAYYGILLMTSQHYSVEAAPPQWPIVVVATFAGFVGSIVDSYLGAWFQYSGYDTDRGCIVERPGDHVTHISGAAILDNHGVNLLTTVVMAIVTPVAAFHLWGLLLI